MPNHGAIHRQIVIYVHDNIRDKQDPDMHAKALEKKKGKKNPKHLRDKQSKTTTLCQPSRQEEVSS